MGIHTHFGMEYDNFRPEWPMIFKTRKARKAEETQQLRVGLGGARVKSEGAPSDLTAA
jgi:hypothetical protein